MKTLLYLTFFLSSLMCVFSAQTMVEDKGEASFLRSDNSNGANALPVNAGGLLPSHDQLAAAGEVAAIASHELAAVTNRLDNTYAVVRTIEVGGTIITVSTGVGGIVKVLADQGLKQGRKIVAKQLAKGLVAAAAVEGLAEGAYSTRSLDEYPFASSAECGAGSRVAAVPRGEQNVQGGDLSSFYQRNNVRAGDQFDVQVVD